MKLNLSKENLKDLVESAVQDCGKHVYVGHGSLTEHEMYSIKYVIIRGRDGLFHVSDFLNANDYVEGEGSNYFIHARIYFDPGNYRQVVTSINVYEYVGNKDGALLATVYYKSAASYYIQDLAAFIHQLDLRLAKGEE